MSSTAMKRTLSFLSAASQRVRKRPQMQRQQRENEGSGSMFHGWELGAAASWKRTSAGIAAGAPPGGVHRSCIAGRVRAAMPEVEAEGMRAFLQADRARRLAVCARMRCRDRAPSPRGCAAARRCRSSRESVFAIRRHGEVAGKKHGGILRRRGVEKGRSASGRPARWASTPSSFATHGAESS